MECTHVAPAGVHAPCTAVNTPARHLFCSDHLDAKEEKVGPPAVDQAVAGTRYNKKGRLTSGPRIPIVLKPENGIPTEHTVAYKDFFTVVRKSRKPSMDAERRLLEFSPSATWAFEGIAFLPDRTLAVRFRKFPALGVQRSGSDVAVT